MSLANEQPTPRCRAPDSASLIARAEAMAPRLRERGRAAETNGRVSEETIAELLAARFHQICQPKSFGGLELDVDILVEVIMALARGCGPTAWITNVFAFHNWQVSMFPLEAQQEYWNGTHNTLSASAGFAVRSEIVAEADGVRLSGHYKFASGASHAHWFIITRAGGSVRDWLMIPRSEVRIVDAWSVSGMTATDSQDILIDDVFIPNHRVLPFSQIETGTSTAARLYRSPFNRLPFFSVAPVGLAAAVIGMGDGLIDVFRDGLAGKRHLGSGDLQVARHSNQTMIGEASAACRFAKLGLRDALATLRCWTETGVPADPAEALVPRRNICAASNQVARMSAKILMIAGSSATALSNPVQRFGRDIIAASTHAGLAHDDAMEAFGKAALGVTDKMPAVIAQA